MTKLFLLLFPFLIFSQTYKVIAVKDGDTVVLLMDGQPQTVRLTHVDCPEKKSLLGMLQKFLFPIYVLGNS